ncbi:hypothetical protein EDB83DRAFT_2647790 [Lactarius deliciosus]|nr:hypothetical protein EDB83DRAFT_2647790 [Lactarius deliciosus]
MSSQLGRAVAAMQEPFPVLTHLELRARVDDDESDVPAPVLPGGFLGGSAPCLQLVDLDNIPFPELPTLLLSSRDLVSLHLNEIPPTGYISPEAMISGLAVLIRLETLCFGFQFSNYLPDQRTRHPDPPTRTTLPSLIKFEFWSGHIDYLEDFVAQLDTPRLESFWTFVDRLDSLQLPQLSLFIARTDTLRFSRAQVKLRNETLRIDLDRHEDEEFELQPPFTLSGSFEWSGTHVAHAIHVLVQVFAMFANLNDLLIHASEDHPGWQDDIDTTEWMLFLHLFRAVETLHVSGRLACQVARALEDVPAEAVTKVLPCLRLLIFDDKDMQVESPEHFVSSRQLYGHPITVVDLESRRREMWQIYAYLCRVQEREETTKRKSIGPSQIM